MLYQYLAVRGTQFEKHLKEAKNGSIDAMYKYIEYLNTNELERWKWLKKALKSDDRRAIIFLYHMEDVDQTNSMYIIGSILKKHYNNGKLFGYYNISPFDGRIAHFRSLINFYKLQKYQTRLAVNAFSLCGIRLGLYKDVRVLLGRYIWKTRKEGLWLRE